MATDAQDGGRDDGHPDGGKGPPLVFAPVPADIKYKVIGCGKGASTIIDAMLAREAGCALDCEIHMLTRDVNPANYLFGTDESERQARIDRIEAQKPPHLRKRLSDAFAKLKNRISGTGGGDEGGGADSGAAPSQPDDLAARATPPPMKDLELQRRLLVEDVEAIVGDAQNLFLVADMDDANGLTILEEVGLALRGRDQLIVDLVFMPTRVDSIEEAESKSAMLHRIRLVPTLCFIIPEDSPTRRGVLVESTVRGLIEVIYTTGLVNIDLADLKTVVSGGNMALMAVGWARGEGRAHAAVDAAFAESNLFVELSGVKKAVVNVFGDESMTLEEAETVSKDVLARINPKARLIWGATVSPSKVERLGVFVMVGAPPKDILIHCYAMT